MPLFTHWVLGKWVDSGIYFTSANFTVVTAQLYRILLALRLCMKLPCYISLLRFLFVLPENQYAEIERYSDRDKPQMNAKREPLTYYLKLTSTYFPVELLQGENTLELFKNL